MSEYDYSKTPVSVDRLSQEIQQSTIITALDHINLFGTAVSIFFKADLSDADKTALDTVVAAHTGVPLPENTAQPVSLTNTVTTQFELRDKTIKLISTSGAVGSDGT